MKISMIRAGCAAACAALIAIPALTVSASAADMTPQERMKMCSAQNKGKKGDEYKTAQKACLSGTAAAPAAPMTQQQKMAKCSAANKGKKGDDYKSAQKACLSA